MRTRAKSVSLSEFKRRSAATVRRMKKNGNPVVLTVKGEAELVVQDVASYRQLLEALDRAEAIAGIRKGLEQMERGETIRAEELFASLRRKYGLSS